MARYFGRILSLEFYPVCLAVTTILKNSYSTFLTVQSMFRRELFSSDNQIDFIEFESIMNHLPPSIFFVALKSSEDRSSDARSSNEVIHSFLDWTLKYSVNMNDLVSPSFFFLLAIRSLPRRCENPHQSLFRE